MSGEIENDTKQNQNQRPAWDFPRLDHIEFNSLLGSPREGGVGGVGGWNRILRNLDLSPKKVQAKYVCGCWRPSGPSHNEVWVLGLYGRAEGVYIVCGALYNVWRLRIMCGSFV